MEQTVVGEDVLDLGLWLQKGEERCLRIGNLRKRMALEKEIVLRMMEDLKQEQEGGGARHPRNKPNTRGTLKEGESSSILETGVATVPRRAVPSHEAGTDTVPEGVGARHPGNKPNTRSCLVGFDMKGKSVATRRAVPNCADYVLTSYAAWWHRMETETSNFFKDVRKEEKKRKLKQQEREKKKREKEEFVKKFFPSCEDSPGGTTRLLGGAATNTARSVAMGKIRNGNLTENPQHLSTFNFDNYFLGAGVTKKARGHSEEPVIGFVGSANWTESADMVKVEFSGSKDDLG